MKSPDYHNFDNLTSVRIQKDTRSVSRQVLSGLKISAVLVVIVILSLFLLRFIPVRHLETYYWHLRHGNSVDVGRYRFPVPKQWYVDSFSANDVLLANLNSGDGIAVRISSAPGVTLGVWDAVSSRTTLDGMKIVGRRELQINGEKVLCVEKKMVRMYPISCRSESGLEVTFVPYLFSAKDHDQMFYSLLQQLQKF